MAGNYFKDGLDLRMSQYNYVVSEEAKKFFKNLFGLGISDEHLKTVQLTTGMILDTFSMFGVYPLVKPVTVNGEMKFSPDILSITKETETETVVSEVDLSKENEIREPEYFDYWYQGFIAAVTCCIIMVARVKGTNKEESCALSMEGQRLLLECFE